MFSEVHKRVQKAGQPPGASVYTGKKKSEDTKIIKLVYSADGYQEEAGKSLEELSPQASVEGVTWIHVEGLANVSVIEQLAESYGIHPLTIEDILNVEQRPKVELFENYAFITLKALSWNKKRSTFSIEQVSFLFGNNFLLSFQENENKLFNNLRQHLGHKVNQRLRHQNSDYLAYRLMDAVVDGYFVVLENIGEEIERIEELITVEPNPNNSHAIYQSKRQLMVLRKAVWPLREMTSRLLQMEDYVITTYTRVYLRDLYDHIVQAMDTLETFRDIQSSMLDMYLSSLTNRMNEIMKILTIIATIFIPITFIASVYGMNFVNMPELHWKWGYYTVLGVMLIIVLIMLNYFRRKKWI